MRKISLPATNTVSIPISLDGSTEADGNGEVYLGAIGADEISMLGTARENGMHIIWSTICLEKKLEDTIADFFFGKTNFPTSRRNVFLNEVLQSSSFQLSFKKTLIGKVVKETEVLKGKESSKLQGCLKKIMIWRNAFAHGILKFDTKDGVLLSYFSGGHQKIILNEDFWGEVESVFEECTEYVDKIDSAL
ncbi:hypothetical protein ACLD02_05995 [Alloalcanivorax sp. C16-2]|uniref:hypothetical protein n=1 Tax=Alloalcanivorax sp. C16-2 TaxID=3390052 RepID=UPI003970BD38